MRTRKFYSVIEGLFLFTLIALIYMLSIFTAKGQDIANFDDPESALFYSNNSTIISVGESEPSKKALPHQ